VSLRRACPLNCTHRGARTAIDDRRRGLDPVIYVARVSLLLLAQWQSGTYRLHFGRAIFKQTHPAPQTPKTDRFFPNHGDKRRKPKTGSLNVRRMCLTESKYYFRARARAVESESRKRGQSKGQGLKPRISISPAALSCRSDGEGRALRSTNSAADSSALFAGFIWLGLTYHPSPTHALRYNAPAFSLVPQSTIP